MSGRATFDFSGKVVIVTGAAGGIGRAASLAFARAGADLMLADIVPDALAELAGEVRKLGRRAEVAVVDLRDEAQVQQMADRTLAAYGQVDVLVNTAAVILRKPSLEHTLEQWERVLDVSLKGTWLACQKVGAIMVRQGSGAIVNFASTAGLRGNPGVPAYGPAKAGIMNLTKGLAIEWGRQGVRVNAIAPGFVRTPLTQEIVADPQWVAAWLKTMPLAQKPMEPEDLAAAVLFLGSDGAQWITGVTLPVDCGISAH